MANMSYCRFQNTLRDLRDCWDALDDVDDLSDEERVARRKLIRLCAEIANYCAEIANYTEDEREAVRP